MPSLTSYLSKGMLLVFAILVNGCATDVTISPLINAEPEVGSVLTRAPRTLRLFYEQLPDVPRSTVTLEGPTGSLNLRGLHTMGADDLMIEIYDDVVDGNYTVYWTTYFENDSTPYQGQYNFTVRAN